MAHVQLINVDAASVVVTGFAGQFVAAFCDLTITPSPQAGGKGNVQERGDQPEGGQTSGKVADRVGSSVSTTRSIDHEHLFHHRVMRQIGVTVGDPGVMQGDKSEAISTAIETSQLFDLRAAEVALAVVNHDIRVAYGIGIGKVGLSKQRSSRLKMPNRPESMGRLASILIIRRQDNR